MPAEAAAPRPTLRDGDLIFQESTSAQSDMVRALTRSEWTHMGVIVMTARGPRVFEAAATVRLTPLGHWVKRGREGRFVVKRLRGARVDAETQERLRRVGQSWLGRAYDARFRWDDGRLYCSELAHKLYASVGIRLGNLQRASEMNLDDPRVKAALARRFAGARFDPNETVVTPDSIFHDPQLVEVVE
jgi:hypothetical protein